MKFSTYKEKMDQATREAKATVIALVVTIVAWIVLGFGLSGLDIKIFNTPLWVLGGTVGIYLVSIAVVLVLRAFVFEDFDLDEHESAEAATRTATPAASASTRIATPAASAGESEVLND